MTVKSDITVITPTIKGRESFLEECKASVEAQTLPAEEHLIFTDVWRKGPAFALNYLWPLVKTEYTQVLADDDLLLPNHIAQMASAAQLAQTGPPWRTDIVHSYCRVEGRNIDFNCPAKEAGYNIPATALIRTSLIKELGGWREKAETGVFEDFDFFRRAAEAGNSFTTRRIITWVYRFHGNNLSMGEEPV